MAAVPSAERVSSSPPSSSSVSHSAAVTESPPVPSRRRREPANTTAVPVLNLSAAQQPHPSPTFSSSAFLPASTLAAPPASSPSLAALERKDDVSPATPSSTRSRHTSAPITFSFNHSTAAAASSTSSSSSSASVSQPRHPRASSTQFSISRYISKFFRPVEPEPQPSQQAAGGALPFASLLSPRAAQIPFATLLRHHRQWSAFLFSLHSESVSFSHHMTAAHSDLAALGRSLYSMYQLKEKEEQQRRRTQHQQETAPDQASASHAVAATPSSALASSLHHVFPISESYSAHTSEASHLYETLVQQRFDQLILPWLTERLRDSERMDAMIVEDRARWQRYEHYSTKLSGLETMLESARREAKELSVSDGQRYERNVEKLAGSRREYELQHARLLHELSCSFEMRFSFLDGLLIELVKAEQAYHAAMHSQLLPIILRIREMMREGRKDKPPPPLPAQPPPAQPEYDAENTVLFASSHPTLSQAGFLSLSLSLSSSSSSLHSHYSILSKIGAGTYGETLLCCTDDEDEGVWVMKRIHCRTVREVNRGMREAMMMSAVRTCQFICKVREVFVEEGQADEEKASAETKEGEPQQRWAAADSVRYEGETETAGEGQQQQQEAAEQPLSGSVFTVCIVMEYCNGGDLQRRISIEASKRRQRAVAVAAALPASSSSSSITVSVPPSAEAASPTADRSFSSPSNSAISSSDDDAASISSASFAASSSSASTAGFTTSRIVSWMYQLCSGLQSLHSALLIHRDIKPDNLFLTSDDTIRIGDCGIMHQLHSASAVTSTAIGTPAYMAPEVVGKRAYGLPADVWSAGCVLYELCTLTSPSFSFRSVDTVLGQVRDRGYGEEIVSLLGRMLSLDEKLRPTAAECVALLKAVMSPDMYPT